MDNASAWLLVEKKTRILARAFLPITMGTSRHTGGVVHQVRPSHVDAKWH